MINEGNEFAENRGKKLVPIDSFQSKTFSGPDRLSSILKYINRAKRLKNTNVTVIDEQNLDIDFYGDPSVSVLTELTEIDDHIDRLHTIVLSRERMFAQEELNNYGDYEQIRKLNGEIIPREITILDKYGSAYEYLADRHNLKKVLILGQDVGIYFYLDGKGSWDHKLCFH